MSKKFTKEELKEIRLLDGIMVKNHVACPVGCGSSDGAAIWQKEYNGKDIHDAFCYACTTAINPNELDMDNLPIVDINKAKEINSERMAEISEMPMRGWRERKVTKKTTEFYKVRTEVDEQGNLRNRYYPVYKEGKLVGYKARNCLQKGFWAVGRNSVNCQMFGQEMFPKGGNKLLICGGEEDAMSAFQMLATDQYITACISPTVGEGNCANQIKANFDYISSFKEVIFMLDNDDAGKAATKECIKLLRPDQAKVWKPHPSMKDVNDYLVADDKAKFKNVFFNTTVESPAGIVASNDTKLWDAIIARASAEKIPLPPFAAQLEEMLKGGPALGEITLLAAACVDKETEYLTPTGWKKISEYTEGDKVAVWSEDKVSFEKPVNYIEADASSFYHFKTSYGCDQMVSPNHTMPFYKVTTGGRLGKLQVKSAQEVYDQHDVNNTGFRGKFINTYEGLGGKGLGLSEGEIRLSVAVKADGRVVKEGKDNYTHMRFRKKRKYDRLLEMCKKFGLKHSDRGWYESERTYQVIVWPQDVEKRYSKWWNASVEDMRIICDEVLHWDGTTIHSNTAFFSYKEDADFIQHCFSSTGIRASMCYANNRIWEVNVTTGKNIGISAGASGKRTIEVVDARGEKQYCFETSTGFWVSRRNNVITVTGNSSVGKTSILNAFTYHWIFNAPYKVGIISLESDLGEFGENLLSLHIQNKLANMYDEEKKEILAQETVQEQYKKLVEKDDGEERFVLLDHQGAVIDDELKRKIEFMVKVQGCKIIILDPLTLALSGSSNDGMDLFNAWYLRFVKREMIAAFNVLHIRKNASGQKANSRGAEISEEDIRGAGSIFQTAANIWLLMRDKYNDNPIVKNTTKVVQSKARRTGNTGTAGYWFYNNETGQLEVGQNPDDIDTGLDENLMRELGAYEDKDPDEFLKEGGY